MAHRFRTRSDGSVYTQVRFRISGRQMSISFDDHAEALQFEALVDKVGGAKAMEICRIVAAPERAMTVSDWLERHNENLTGVEAGTLNRYRTYADSDIGPVLGPIPLTALTPEDIARWVNGLRKPNGDKPSGKTIANKHGYLAGALNTAVERGIIKANPCDHTRLPRWHREEMVFLERDEYAILRNAVTEYWRPLVDFLVTSGCRWSEATALKPSDVDRTAGTVRISKAWKTISGQGYMLGTTKTKMSVRTINVPRRILDQLDYSGAWLFTNSGRGRRNPEGVVRIHSFNPNVWQPALERAEANGLTKRPRIHDLRHTCASWLIAGGRPLPAVQQHLGHENINTTVGVYHHLDRSSGQGNADVLSDAIDFDDEER